MVQKVFWICEAKNGTKVNDCCRPEHMGLQTLEEGTASAKETNNWRIEGEKKRITREEYQRLFSSLKWKVY